MTGDVRVGLAVPSWDAEPAQCSSMTRHDLEANMARAVVDDAARSQGGSLFVLNDMPQRAARRAPPRPKSRPFQNIILRGQFKELGGSGLRKHLAGYDGRALRGAALR